MNDELPFEAVAELARRTKVEKTKAWLPGTDEQECDIDAHVLVRRGDRTVALVAPGPNHGPEGLRRTVYIAAVLMRPTELFVVMDSVTVIDPLEVGSVQGVRAGDLVMRWHAGNRDNLTEALVITRYDATGCTGSREHKYVRMGGIIMWTKSLVDTDGLGTVGALADNAVQGFADAAGVWTDAMVADLHAGARADNAPPEQEEYHTDRSCAAMASQYDQGVCKLLETGDTFVGGTELPS